VYQESGGRGLRYEMYTTSTGVYEAPGIRIAHPMACGTQYRKNSVGSENVWEKIYTGWFGLYRNDGPTTGNGQNSIEHASNGHQNSFNTGW
jgi:hypothetical protein